MNPLANIDEMLIRSQCRRQYRDEGSLRSIYPTGSFEALIWQSEATNIQIEEIESSMHGN